MKKIILATIILCSLEAFALKPECFHRVFKVMTSDLPEMRSVRMRILDSGSVVDGGVRYQMTRLGLEVHSEQKSFVSVVTVLEHNGGDCIIRDIR